MRSRFASFLGLVFLATSFRGAAAGEALVLPPSPAAGPRLFVLSIGINAYPGKDRLHFCVKDARDIAQVFQEKGKRLYRQVETRLLTDGEADRAAILDGLAWLRREVAPQDRAVIFYSGHGGKDPKLGFFLVPSGFKDRQARETMVSGAELRKAAGEIRGSVLVLLDCCYAGAVLREAERVAEATRPPSGPVFLCASRAGEESGEDRAIRHGAFTKAVLEALNGKADANHDGAVSLEEVERYVRPRVRKLSNNEQHLVRGGAALAPATLLTRP